jgi:hypothetical protein
MAMERVELVTCEGLGSLDGHPEQVSFCDTATTSSEASVKARRMLQAMTWVSDIL